MASSFRTQRNNQKKSSLRPYFFLFLLILFGVGLYFYSAIRSIGSYLLPEESYTITSGMNLSSLSQSLEWDVSPSYYRLWVKFFAPEVDLQVGKYSSSGMTIEEFLTS